MSLKKLNQGGVAAAEAVLIVVILAIVAGTGYYVLQAQNKTTDNLNNADSASQSAVPPKPKKLTGAQATALVQKAYDKYQEAEAATAAKNAKAPTDNTNSTIPMGGLVAVKAYLSPDLYKKISTENGGKDFGCTFNYAADAYKAKLSSTNNTSAIVAVDIIAGTSTNGTLQATLDLNTQKITAVTCPQ